MNPKTTFHLSFISFIPNSLEENQLKKVTNGDEMHYLLKINYYPPCPCPNLVLGVPTLTDMSYLTILVPNEVQGLQVCRDGHCMVQC